MSKLPVVLLVEDSASVARAVALYLRDTATVETLTSVVEAIDYLDTHPPLPLIVDVKLTDGSGFDVVAHGRSLDPDLPVLVMSGDSSFVNRAYSLGVNFVLKPVEKALLVSFVQGAAKRKQLARDVILPALEAWSEKHDLTPSERQIVVATTINRVPRSQLARALGKAEGTVKTQTRHILENANEENLEGVSAAILRDALKRV